MAFDDDNIYYNPEKFGLVSVGEIEWSSRNYEFDTTAVFRDPETGTIFIAEDAGCSCPMPFERYIDRSKLTPMYGWADLNDHLMEMLPEPDDDGVTWGRPSREKLLGDIGALIQKVRAL